MGKPSALRFSMASTTRWLSPLANRPADYPRDLPFLSERSCLLSRSGAGESELFSVIWPASEEWPADCLRQQPGPTRTLPLTVFPTLGELRDDPSAAKAALRSMSWIQTFGPLDRPWIPWATWVPDEVSTVFGLVCERSREAGWSWGRNVERDTAWFEKGPRVRLIIAAAAGGTLQEGLPEREAA